MKLIIAALLLTNCAGPRGFQGHNGIPGTSCTAAPIEGGALITCTDGTTALILNGVDGEPGSIIDCHNNGDNCRN